MPGQLVDVGGYKMHIDCVGQGSPTVILESGLGDSYVSWQKVQPQIAQFTRVCSYDRAGLGYSDFSPRPRASEVMAEELYTLLQNSGISGPIVLVGHSLGGYNVRVFASLYRSDVAGMVLGDSSHPEQAKRLPPAVNDLQGSWLRAAEFLEFITSFGIPRVLGFCGSDAVTRAAECTFSNTREGVAEMKSFSESAAQAGLTQSLGDLPLEVLSHDPNTPQPDLPEELVKPTNDAWEQMQEELAHLSTKGTQRPTAGTTFKSTALTLWSTPSAESWNRCAPRISTLISRTRLDVCGGSQPAAAVRAAILLTLDFHPYNLNIEGAFSIRSERWILLFAILLCGLCSYPVLHSRQSRKMG